MPTSKREFYKAGDVVVVPFPFSDRLAEKRRPALVISSETLAKTGFVWLVMITSAENAPLAHDLPIKKLQPTGLSSASLVRPVKIACVEPGRVVRRIGYVQAGETALVLATLRDFIGDIES